MWMIVPFFCSIITRPTAWLTKNVPFRFTASVLSKSSSRTISAGFSGAIPALFTRMSMRPNCSTVCPTARKIWSILPTSICSGSAFLPSFLISAVTRHPPSRPEAPAQRRRQRAPAPEKSRGRVRALLPGHQRHLPVQIESRILHRRTSRQRALSVLRAAAHAAQQIVAQASQAGPFSFAPLPRGQLPPKNQTARPDNVGAGC